MARHLNRRILSPGPAFAIAAGWDASPRPTSYGASSSR